MILEILILVVGALGTYEGFRLTHTNLLYSDSVGPGWYLLFMALLLLLCAIALLLRRCVWKKVDEDENPVVLHKGAVGLAFLLLFLYGATIPRLGYLISSLIFFTLVQWNFGERSWIRSSLIGACITATFYFVFSYFAAVPLP